MIDTALLLDEYKKGFFPMAEARSGEIRWYSPDPRAIIPINGLNVSRSLQQTIKKQNYSVKTDTAFEEVMRACARREETWISEEIIKSYAELHRLGFAHSLEVWTSGKLAGGLYGVALGAAFFGESMFSLKRDASKIALFYLVEHLRPKGYELLDTQFITPHLASLGAIEIPRDEYILRLRNAVLKNRRFTD